MDANSAMRPSITSASWGRPLRLCARATRYISSAFRAGPVCAVRHARSWNVSYSPRAYASSASRWHSCHSRQVGAGAGAACPVHSEAITTRSRANAIPAAVNSLQEYRAAIHLRNDSIGSEGLCAIAVDRFPNSIQPVADGEATSSRPLQGVTTIDRRIVPDWQWPAAADPPQPIEHRAKQQHDRERAHSAGCEWRRKDFRDARADGEERAGCDEKRKAHAP